MIRLRLLLFIALLSGLWACSPSVQAAPTPSPIPPKSALIATIAPSHILPTLTSTPLICLNQPPRVDSGQIDTTKPPQQFLIYLPPCYDANTNQRYAVLYLLHGQTYIDDQWVRLGAPKDANQMILAGQSVPFIMVFPDDRYWYAQAEAGFGDRIVNAVIPYIDSHYRTFADRPHRAIGGLSLGGGWAACLGLTYYTLFSSVGLHSPATQADCPNIQAWVKMVPPTLWPRIWIDAGDQDRGLGATMQFEDSLSFYQIPHQWHMYNGDHSESYWGAHVMEYLQWYAAGWNADSAAPQP
jgi:enterochelin esterase-like enzyme